MRVGISLIVIGLLLLAPLGLFIWAHYFYTVGVDGPGLMVLSIAGAATVLTGSAIVLRARRGTLDQERKTR